MNRRGQEGGGAAAVTVTIIAALTVLYIIFLPPDFRQEILEGKTLDEIGDDNEEEFDEEILLRENPGKLYPDGDTEFTHSIPPIRLYSITEGKTIYDKGSLDVERSIVQDLSPELIFNVEKPLETSDVLLSFLVTKGEGTLYIEFNGQSIFSGRLDSGNVEPIKIPRSLLLNQNSIKFKVSSPKAKFWKTNRYILRQIKITGDITDRSSTKAKTTIFIDNQEVVDTKRVRFFMQTICDRKNAGNLNVILNGGSIFSGPPDCGSYGGYEVSPLQIQPGKNELEFSIDWGNYFLNNMRMTVDLKKPKDNIYYFEIKQELFKDLQDGERRLNATFEFVDTRNKEAKIYVNDFIRTIDTRDKETTFEISDFVKQGFNSLEIEPKNEISIKEVKIIAG